MPRKTWLGLTLSLQTNAGVVGTTAYRLHREVCLQCIESQSCTHRRKDVLLTGLSATSTL